MDNNIKVSDVLLEILAKTRNIEKFQKLQDLQYKLLLKRIDKLSKIISDGVDGIEETGVVETYNVATVGRASQVEATEDVPMPEPPAPVAQDDDGDFNFKPKVLDAETIKEEPARTFPVTQVVSYNKAPIVAADILVTNSSGEKVKGVQTNNKGRWQAVLPIGTYIVNAKWQTSEAFVEFTQSFEVPETASSIITLQMPKALKKTKK